MTRMTTITPLEAKIAGVLHDNITNAVVKASTNRYLCKLNLHNNTFLKKLNHRLGVIHRLATEGETLVQSPYEHGSDDGVENALLAIRHLIEGNYYGSREFLFKRLDFITSSALSELYDRRHREWIDRITAAIQNASSTKSVKRTKPVQRKQPRNKKGQFIKTTKTKKIKKRR